MLIPYYWRPLHTEFLLLSLNLGTRSAFTHEIFKPPKLSQRPSLSPDASQCGALSLPYNEVQKRPFHSHQPETKTIGLSHPLRLSEIIMHLRTDATPRRRLWLSTRSHATRPGSGSSRASFAVLLCSRSWAPRLMPAHSSDFEVGFSPTETILTQ
ncbi:hypothetical protein IW261DRAFT_91460 [Armillaria novae-zelandiae]|uniref:Uncharacterized protein n=1 Tax=Armillaria novae-zelandiae TaxID=153914 RepID=A0AA39PXI3_9AGAR|nr:hypothetical protein IW261DRAFT_91460 [Armillaria novae-zelandiae]